MKSIIKKSLQSLLLVPILALAASFAVPVVQPVDVYAQCADDTYTLNNGVECAKGDDQSASLFGTGGIFKTITNTLLFIIGAVSVIMIIFGGFKYVTSSGDSAAVSSAKNTILYAVIGLVVAVLGYAVINFVVGSLASNTAD